MTNIVPMKNIWVKPLSKVDKKRLGQIFQRFQQAKKGELEESVALALQNYHSGLIDADDFISFLLPTRLEEGGPGSGWFAPPKGTHGKGKQSAEEARRFSKASGADKWAKSAKSLNPTLNKAQDEAMQQYKGEDFLEVNNELRMGGSSEMRLNSDPDQYLDELIESSFKGTSLLEPVIVYRGLDWDVFEDFDDLTGDVISDDAFVSTSMIRRIAESHSDGLVMEIRLPKGAQAIYMDKWKVTGFDTESELLLPKGSKFKVISDVNRPDEYERKVVVELVL